MVKQRLNTHEYQQSENAQQLRCLENLYLVEFKELSLKNYKGFEEGIKFFTESKLKDYLSKFHVIFPGDHPMQYFCRQIVYANSYCRQNIQDTEPQDVFKSSTDKDSTLLQKNLVTLPDNLIQSFITFIGGLHIQLNAQEDLVGNYHKFVKFMYESIFESSVLALGPRPWRTSNILEIIYGGGTLDSGRRNEEICQE